MTYPLVVFASSLSLRIRIMMAFSVHLIHQSGCTSIVDLDVSLLDDEEEELAVRFRCYTCQPLISHCSQQALLFQVMPGILSYVERNIVGEEHVKLCKEKEKTTCSAEGLYSRPDTRRR